MSTVPVPRWAVSFADLGLLLLGCFVLLHAMESARPKASADVPRPESAPGQAYAAATLFQPGEAVLRPEARLRLQAEGRRLATRRIDIVSRGGGESIGRLDRFELSAARAAAFARALQQGGLPANAIAITTSADGAEAQVITVRVR
jgi:flagellar motor protein MotB